MFPAQGAGKGDADRSPRWREGYSGIEWGIPQPEVTADEFLQGRGFFHVRPGRLKKIYR